MNIKNKALLKYTLASGGTAGVAIPTAVLLLERDEWDEDKHNQEMSEIKRRQVCYEQKLVAKDQEIEQIEHAIEEEREATKALSETIGQLLEDDEAVDGDSQDGDETATVY